MYYIGAMGYYDNRVKLICFHCKQSYYVTPTPQGNLPMNWHRSCGSAECEEARKECELDFIAECRSDR